MLTIQGQTVKLYDTSQTDTDPFGQPIMTEEVVEIENVLIEPASNEDITNSLDIDGKKVTYILHIPRTDTHDWRDKKVEFYGQIFRTFGDCLIYDPDLTPLEWGKKIKVERYE